MAVSRRIAFIDLGSKQIEIIPVPDKWRQRFLGGRGLGAWLACKYTSPGCDALESGNTMVISAGLLAGTLSTPFATACITAKAPLTGFLESALLPGLFAAEMRWAGFDHLVVSGRARRPVSLFIHNGSIEIIDADSLKGCGVSKACDLVRKELGDEDLKILAIGPAGENLVRFATIADDAGRTTGRTGMGAVLGSKKVKALACRGTLDLEIKSPKAAIRYHHALPPEEGADVVETQPETAAVSLHECLNLAEDIRIPVGIDRVVADFGMDPQVFTLMADWSAGCYERGLITGKSAAQSRLQDRPFAAAPELAEQIALRKVFGDTLAQGPLRALMKVGSSSLAYFGSVKNLLGLHTETVPADDSKQHIPAFTAKKRSAAVYRGKPGVVAHRELSTILLDILGNRQCVSVCPRTGRLDTGRAIDLIRLNTGLELHPKELHKIAYRCYAVERLYNLREIRACRKQGQMNTCLEVPGGIRLNQAAWNDVTLESFRRLATGFYRENGWDRKAAAKKKVLEHLGIGELWDTVK